VIPPDAPENSLETIRLASQRSYDMVDLDLMAARDQVPLPKPEQEKGCGNTIDFAVD
jgi:hypothetical protein